MSWFPILAAVLFVLWGAGMIAGMTAGGLIHILLIAAVVLLVVPIMERRRSRRP